MRLRGDMMKKEVAVVLTNAILWGFVMIGCSLVLKGTGAYKEIQMILAGGAVASMSVVPLIVIHKPVTRGTAFVFLER